MHQTFSWHESHHMCMYYQVLGFLNQWSSTCKISVTSKYRYNCIYTNPPFSLPIHNITFSEHTAEVGRKLKPHYCFLSPVQSWSDYFSQKCSQIFFIYSEEAIIRIKLKYFGKFLAVVWRFEMNSLF